MLPVQGAVRGFQNIYPCDDKTRMDPDELSGCHGIPSTPVPLGHNGDGGGVVGGGGGGGGGERRGQLQSSSSLFDQSVRSSIDRERHRRHR